MKRMEKKLAKETKSFTGISPETLCAASSMNPPGESIVGKLPAGALAGFDLPSTLCSDLNLTPEEIARRTARQNDPRCSRFLF